MQKIDELSNQLNELQKAKALLEDRLGKEIQDKDISLKLMEN